MTQRERLIVSAYTGYLMCDFDKLHEYIEQVMGRPVWTHEMGTDDFEEEIRRRVKPEFLKLCGNEGQSDTKATMADRIKFWLDGCDISFIAEAPEDITLKQLLAQCDKIQPDWCACGIRSLGKDDDRPAQIAIDYDGIRKADDTAPCKIEDDAS